MERAKKRRRYPIWLRIAFGLMFTVAMLLVTAVAPPLPELVAFLESLPEPHILCDRDYRILAANAAYRAQCAGKRDVVGRTCYEVSHHYAVPCDQSGESCPRARAQRSGRREHVLHLHYTPAGETYESIELSPIAGADGAIVYFVEKLQPLPVARGRDGAHRLVGRSPAFLRLMMGSGTRSRTARFSRYLPVLPWSLRSGGRLAANSMT